MKEHLFFKDDGWGGGDKLLQCYLPTCLWGSDEPNSNISMFKAVLLVFQAFKLFQFVSVIVMCQRHRHIQSGLKRQYGPDDKVPQVLRA